MRGSVVLPWREEGTEVKWEYGNMRIWEGRLPKKDKKWRILSLNQIPIK